MAKATRAGGSARGARRRSKAKQTRRENSGTQSQADKAQADRAVNDRNTDKAAPRPQAERSNGEAKKAKAAAASVLGMSRKVAASAPAIVIKAATILEEELASGLGVARRIEQRFLDVEKLRNQSSDAVMSKFRRDAHDAVDIILDVLTAAAQTVSAQAVRFVNVTAGAAEKKPASGGVASGMQVPALRVPGQVAAGASGEVSMLLENTSEAGTSGFTLHCSDLLSASGAKIPAASIAFTPQTLSVAPKEAGRVTVSVSVPENTPAGIYEGLVRATQLESLRAMLTVVVS